jgi:hypothetical protein
MSDINDILEGAITDGLRASGITQPGLIAPLVDDILAALNCLPVAVVELPDPDDTGGGPAVDEFDAWWGHYPDNDPRKPARWPNYDVTAAGGRCGYGVGGQFSPAEARLFAAALLAAAGVAEAVAHG